MVKKRRDRGKFGDTRRWGREDGGIWVGYGSSILQPTAQTINIDFFQCTDVVKTASLDLQNEVLPVAELFWLTIQHSQRRRKICMKLLEGVG
ncbi:uncharacterized protein ARMOST_17490 [Armillaria ostoyae]|uniref:Uncharacterized protein n=1 Tax=Armillaria ostoyae TaxID=47428 RepID=A0A284RZ55_ARMOS|nr:uncharacterized protein ARMOST_17490 [Armillaria ostoyae]